MEWPFEPYRTKVVERIRLISREERLALLRQAGYNLFWIPSDAIYIDLLTDSGTSAMSDAQWAAMMTGDESYACSRNFIDFETTIRDIFGYQHVIPTHQGRAAEHLLFADGAEAGRRGAQQHPLRHHARQRRAPGRRGAATWSSTRGSTRRATHPFKGNLDPGEARPRPSRGTGASAIPLVMITITNNSGGGQPVSMANVRAVREVCDAHGVPLIFDACRFAENCWFIQQREPGYAERSVAEIAREMFSLRRRLHDERQEGRAGQHRRLPRPQRRRLGRAGHATCSS